MQIEFNVLVGGEPIPEITWLIDDTEVINSPHIYSSTDGDQSSLTIESALLEDSCLIKCRAVNARGAAVSKARFIVEGKSVRGRDD